MSALEGEELYANHALSLLVERQPGWLVHMQRSEVCPIQGVDHCPLFQCSCASPGEREEMAFLSSSQLSPLADLHCLGMAGWLRESRLLCDGDLSVAPAMPKQRFSYLTS